MRGRMQAGINLGSDETRLVWGRVRADGFDVERWARLSAVQADSFVSELRLLVEEWGMRRRQAALSLCTPELYWQPVSLPRNLSRRQLTAAVPLQIQRLFNAPAGQFVYDAVPLEDSGTEICRWAVVAARQTRAEALARAVMAAGLRPVSLEPELSALARCIEPLPDDTALLYLQTDYAALGFWRQGRLQAHYVLSASAPLEKSAVRIIREYDRDHPPVRIVMTAGNSANWNAETLPAQRAALQPTVRLPADTTLWDGRYYTALGLAMRGG